MISTARSQAALAEIKYTGYVTTELSGGDAAYLKDVSARVDRFQREKPVAASTKSQSSKRLRRPETRAHAASAPYILLRKNMVLQCLA